MEAVSRAPREAGLSIPSIAKKIVMAIIEKILDEKLAAVENQPDVDDL